MEVLSVVALLGACVLHVLTVREVKKSRRIYIEQMKAAYNAKQQEGA